MSGSVATRVIMAVLTIGSRDAYFNTIEQLRLQRIPSDVEASIVVIDNNADSRISGLAPEVAVVHEPHRGIPAARNAALAHAGEHAADVVAFIDDDAVPKDEHWLAKLLHTLDQYGGDAVTGPVQYSFPSLTPQWLRDQEPFRRALRPTGTQCQWAATGNIAIRMDLVHELGLQFDTRLGLVGGSDTDFTRRLVAAGGTIIWDDEAEVLEFVSPERASCRWVLRRSWRYGSNRIQRIRLGTPGAYPTWKVFIGAFAEVILGLVGAAAFVLPSRRMSLMLLARAARGAGTFAALAGKDFAEYAHR